MHDDDSEFPISVCAYVGTNTLEFLFNIGVSVTKYGLFPYSRLLGTPYVNVIHIVRQSCSNFPFLDTIILF